MKQQQSRTTKPKSKRPPNQARRTRKCSGTRAPLVLSLLVVVFLIIPSSSIEFLCTPAEVSIRFRIPTTRSVISNNSRTTLLEKEEANDADNILKEKSTTLRGDDGSSSTLVVFENDGLVLPDGRFESLAGGRRRQRHPFITAEIQGRSYPVRGMGGGNDRTSRLGFRLTFGNGDHPCDKRQQQRRHKNGPNRVPTRGLVKNEIRAVKHFSSDVMKRVRDVQLATKRHVYDVRASLGASIKTVRSMIIPSSTSSSRNNRRRHRGGVTMDEDDTLDDTADHDQHHDHHHHHGSSSSSRIGTLASTVVGAGGKITDQTRRELVHYTQRLMKSVLRALNDDALWTKVVHRDGVTVWRTSADVKNLHPDDAAATTITTSRKTRKADATVTAPKLHTVSDGGTIRTEAVLDAPPEHVYRVFMDDSLVSEYNDNCRELEDILHIDDRTKINWCATGKFGPFKARDFVTLVHFRELDDEEGSYVQLASHVDEAEALCPPRTDEGYVRSQIRLAATFMRPLPGDPNRTHFVQLTQVGDLGGVADSAVAKKIKKRLEETSPVEFVKKFNEVLIRSLPRDEVRREEEEQEEESSRDAGGTEERRGEREGRNRPFFRLVDQRVA